MIDLTKEKIEQAISELKNEVKDFPISKAALVKFTDSEEDKRFSSYIYNKDNGGWCLKFVPALIEKLGIKNILELGNREGVSTLCIWDHLPKDANFTSVDIIKDLRYCPKDMFSDKRVRFVFGDVSNPNIYNGKYPKDIEFMYMDTIHYDFQASDEFEVNQHFLADKALVAVDDINLNDKRKFFDRLTYQKWDLTELCHGSGWGLFLYERKEPLTLEQKILDVYKAATKIFIRKYEEDEKIIEKIEKKKNFLHH